jgi:RNA polymerase sigma-70 factor, ECF subfamily
VKLDHPRTQDSYNAVGHEPWDSAEVEVTNAAAPEAQALRVRNVSPAEAVTLAAALAHDQDAFRRLTDPYVREIHLHCYRMLGSFHDAEDAVQETLLRAWKYLPSLQDLSSMRGWLHRIATNICLRQRAHSKNDPLMSSTTLDGFAPAVTQPYHLSPYPDALLDQMHAPGGIPAVEYDLYESVQLAFLIMVQLLPPRQRAVLLLHDVIGFTLVEIADMLDTTVASVNSALNRARSTLRQARANARLSTPTRPSDQFAESFVMRCVAAWQSADMARLAEMLKADVVMGAPTWGLRLNGRSTVCEFLGTVPAADERAKFRFIATRANRQPALAVYRLDEIADSETYRALGIVVLTMDGNAVNGIAMFPDPKLVPTFGLPTHI